VASLKKMFQNPFNAPPIDMIATVLEKITGRKKTEVIIYSSGQSYEIFPNSFIPAVVYGCRH
jgi:trehalose-6-phosphatase